ncbi:MAG: hypothetical protein Q3996_02535 [Candidatus Saccharibacteria bacterium]|nr:hypothetical protein [Candidatus Saccharibacteria bacterium]
MENFKIENFEKNIEKQQTQTTTDWDTLEDVSLNPLANKEEVEPYDSFEFKLGEYNLEMNASIEMTPDSGVLEVTDKELSIPTVESIDDPNQIYLVHSTDFFPNNKTILSNADGGKINSFSKQIDYGLYVVNSAYSPRETVHFTMNGRVRNTSDGAGNWDNQKFIVIEPFMNHQNELVSGAPHSGDNFIDGSVRLSDDAILMVREDAYDNLSDQQKSQYNIIKYFGNADICTKNLLHSLGLPAVDNQANDAGHAYSEQYHQEYILEKRAEAVKEIANVDLSKTRGANFLSKEDIATLYKITPSDYYPDSPKAEPAKILANSLGITEETASFILANGVYRDASGYALLSNEMTKKCQDNPEWYIESVKRNGKGFSELQDCINTSTIDTYQQSSTLEKNHEFENITIGQLHTLRNYGTLKKVKDSLGIDNDKAIILREDGLYIGKDSLSDMHREKSNDEILLGSNSDTIHTIIENYRSLNNSKYFL